MHEQGDTNPPAFLQNTSLFPKNSLPIPFLGLRTTKQRPRAGFEVSNTSNFYLKTPITRTLKFRVLAVARYQLCSCPVPSLTGTS